MYSLKNLARKVLIDIISSVFRQQVVGNWQTVYCESVCGDTACYQYRPSENYENNLSSNGLRGVCIVYCVTYFITFFRQGHLYAIIAIVFCGM